MTRRRRGFTLVEMLVVIAIIGILAGLLTPAVQAARKNAIRRQCQSQINNLALACESFKADLGFYPDSRGFEQFSGVGASSSEPIPSNNLYNSDVLYMWLCNQFAYRGKVYGPYYSPKSKEVMPVSGKTYHRPDDKDVPIMYFVDPWGQPLIYIDFTNYGNDATQPKEFAGGELGDVTAASKPERDNQGQPKVPAQLGQTFYNEQGFQIYSFGANGKSGYEPIKSGDPLGDDGQPGWFGTDTPESGKYLGDPKLLDDVNNWDG